MAFSAKDFQELRLEGVRREFGALNALSDIDLSVRRGEFIALLGPSGCGKSTALNCLAGLLALSGGSIWLDRTRIDHLPPEARGFGMVFQNYALFPHMNLRANIAFGLKMKRASRTEIATKVEEALTLVRLSAHADKLPGQISGGQQQRVAIARAIVVEPPLVLMDEPLSNLDAKLRLEMRGEIRRIHNLLGCSTIYVTHDQDEALSLADRIVVMREGMVRQIGTPEELYSRPAHADVAEFMGYRNIFTGPTEQRADGSLRLSVAGAWLAGTALEPLPNGAACAAIRPEDLIPDPAGPLVATVTACEFRGRDFYLTARTDGDAELYFRSERRFAAGETVRLSAPADRVLVYSAPPS
ncbi:MAG: ABC transporter ATP-binding protein [Acetobacteraceae bacterium]